MADLSDTIETAAGKPKSAEADGRKAEAHPLPDQVEADKYLKANDGVNIAKHRGLRFNKLVPPGTV